MNFSKEELLKYRRQIMENEVSNMNDMQKKAIFKAKGPVLILAGAGSGKTTVLVNRISHIIRYGNAYESELVPCGITEETLNEMKNAATLPREELGEFLMRFRESPPPAWSVLAITFTNKASN